MRTLIIALGNELMKDDGVGLKVGRILAEKGYNVLEAGTDIFLLSNHYQGEERLVIVDAVLSDKFAPGSVVHLKGRDVFEKLKAELRSAHFMGVIDGLKLLMKLDERLAKAEVHFVGIVVEKIELGTELSSSVEKAVPRAVEIIEKIASS